MTTRQIEKERYDHVLYVLRTTGRREPLRIGFEVDVAVNGVSYSLMLHNESPRKIIVLQAVKSVRDVNGNEQYELLTESVVLRALLEIWLYQLP